MVNSIDIDSYSAEELERTGEHKSQNIHILLVDNEISILQNLHQALKSKPKLCVVAWARDSQLALSKIKSLSPDVALIDLEMSSIDGLQLTKIISEYLSHTKVIILGNRTKPKLIQRAYDAGAKGYLPKKAPVVEIEKAIRLVYQGKSLAVLKDNQSSIEIVREANSEWSSMTEDIVDTLPQIWSRGLLYLIFAFIGVVLPWAIFFKVDIVGSARGRLEPQGRVYKVDTISGGTIEKVMVEEGQFVKQHQPIIVLESKPIVSELQQFQAQSRGYRQEVAQLIQLKTNLGIKISAQQQQNQARQLEKQAQVQRAIENVSNLQASKNLNESDRLETLKEVERYREANVRGIVAEIQVTSQENILREKERIVQQADAQLQQAIIYSDEQQQGYQSLIREGKIVILQIEEQLQEISRQIITLKSNIKTNKNQLDALNYQMRQRTVKAPVSGSIFELSTAKLGSVLAPGEEVAEIAPQASPLILKARLASSDSGFLNLNMPVKLKFDAYPFQNFGILRGKLIGISPTTKPSESADETFPSYELEIELEKSFIQTKKRNIPLRPGQTATAEIIIRQRRLISFVLEPLLKN